MSDNVYIIGVGMFRFGKYPEKSIKQMTAEVVDSLLADCPVEKKDIEAAWFSNSFWGIVTGQHSIRGQVALVPLGIEGIPIMNVENACAGATSAVNGCYLGIKVGALRRGPGHRGGEDVQSRQQAGHVRDVHVQRRRGVHQELLAAFQEDEKKKAEEAGAGGGKKRRRGGALPLHGPLRHGGPHAHGEVRHHPAAAGDHRRQEPLPRLPQPPGPVPDGHDASRRS